MIGLNGSLDQLPAAFHDHFINDLLQPLLNWSDQDTPSSFRTEDQMIHDQMHTLSIMLIVHLPYLLLLFLLLFDFLYLYWLSSCVNICLDIASEELLEITNPESRNFPLFG
jgi:hypothetical protein